jgi:hypothetical protein
MQGTSRSATTRAERVLDAPWGFLAFFLILTILHVDALDLRPSEDQARGIWMEAAFLYETNFDFGYLARHAQYYSGPAGERAYLVSVLPAGIALLRMATGSPDGAILAYKLFTLACGAGVARVVYSLLRRRLDVWESTLAAAAAMTMPAVACQLDMLGMELPAMLLLSLGVRALVEERYQAAALWHLAAGFIKLVSLVFVFGAILYIAALAACGHFSRAPQPRRRPALGAAMLLGVFALQVLLFRASGQSDPANVERPTGPRLLRPDAMQVERAVPTAHFSVRDAAPGAPC